MSDRQENETRGVLSGLPSTRPQRPSPKRRPAAPAARPAKAGGTGKRTTPAPTKGPRVKRAAPGGGQPVAAGPPRPARTTERRPAPAASQGYEPERARGSVDPPSRTDLVGSVANGAGDLAQASLDLSRHLLRAVLRRLPGR